MNESNITSLTSGYPEEFIDFDDASWVLASLFTIISIQAGMALREVAVVSTGNDVNVVTKCICSVVLGGFAYWIFGYALSFGRDYGTNPFCGWGSFFVTAPDVRLQGWQYAHFFHHLSYVTMATTLVSGAMAGKMRLKAYMVYCIVNVLLLVFPMHWVWGHNGWLKLLGATDVSGAGPVHMISGTHSLVLAKLMLRRRMEKSNPESQQPTRESPEKMLIGSCLIWCGFHSLAIGSAFGIAGLKWKLASRAVVNTFISSSTGAIVAILLSYYFNKGKIKTGDLTQGILGSLVGVSGISRVTHPWAAVIIGGVSSALAYFVPVGLNKLKVNDPVNGVAVHGACGLWGVLSVGIFGVLELEGQPNTYRSMIEGGGLYLFGVQTLEAVILIFWSAGTSVAVFKVIDVTIGLSVTPEVEKGGLDLYEHGVGEPPAELSEKPEKREDEKREEKKREEVVEEKDGYDSSSEGRQKKSEEDVPVKTHVRREKDVTNVSHVNEKSSTPTRTPGVRVGTDSRQASTNPSRHEVEVHRPTNVVGTKKTQNTVSHVVASVVGDQEENAIRHSVEDGTISKKNSLERKDSGYDSGTGSPFKINSLEKNDISYESEIETIPKTFASETKDKSCDSGNGSEEDTAKKGSRRLRSIKGSISKACSIIFSNDSTLSTIQETSTDGETVSIGNDPDLRKSILKSILDRKSVSLKRREKVLRFLEGDRVTYPATDTFPRISRGQTMTFMFHDSD
ncbi:putative ammonium transporter 3 [Branchiostoma floridae]|uniref:Ammonium transporter 3 n=1 Tax=Branchiostoma floridae TaxID=7739 RepID=A0A9J7K7M7_BRAFL|nr:putative ammonium transporter 3 [Branchiostoma floridae]